MKKIMLIISICILLVSCSSKSEESNIKSKSEMSAFDKAKIESENMISQSEKVTTDSKKVDEVKKPQTKEMYTICIDPGHQEKQISTKEPIAPGSSKKKMGVASGATGVSTKRPEYKLTLEVSKLIQKKLEAKGYNIVMTRETNDVSLTNIERAKIGNASKANLVVRIHADSNADPSVRGFSVLYPDGEYTQGIHSESKKASEKILTSIKEATGGKSRGIIPRSDMTGFNWSSVPSVIVEMGFLSNPEEDELLSTSEYQEKMANGIINGIEEYLN